MKPLVSEPKKRIAKARDRDVLDEDFPELVTFEGGAHRIRDNSAVNSTTCRARKRR